MNKSKEFRDLFSDMISKIDNRVKLHAFIIFGSQSRGNSLFYSDYDIVIIADFKEKYIKRGKWIVQMAPDIPVDIFCYTPEEFDEMFHQYNLTAIDCIDEGVFVKGEDYLKKYKEKLKFFKQKGLKKKKNVLIPPSL